MGEYIDKQKLYEKISDLKVSLGFNSTDYGFDFVALAKKAGYKIEEVPFETKGLRGMANIGESFNDDVILLNSFRSEIEQNFDFGHELIHTTFHRNLNRKMFNCFDKVPANQDTYIEWQANEGSAEFIVPYKSFIPDVYCAYSAYNSVQDSEILDFLSQIPYTLAKKYNTTTSIINLRIENLKYEIYQYFSGMTLEHISILSNNQQQKKGIECPDFLTIVSSYR